MSQSYNRRGEGGVLNADLKRGRLSKLPIIRPSIPYLRIDEHAISITSELADLIDGSAAVAIGVSGGKDSQAAAIATIRYLDHVGHVGHAGPRLLIHADLGSVEWNESLPACERLGSFLGTELIVVRRKQGGLMERWEGRWASNVARYQQLSTVTLVPCWSTPRMRFCTSEAKTSPIQSALKRWSPHLPIISVTGVRRQESRQRARAGIMDHKSGERIWTWRPILDWSEKDVFFALDAWASILIPRTGCSS